MPQMSLIRACMRNNTKMALKKIKNGSYVDCSHNGKSALQFACENNNTKIAITLINAGANLKFGSKIIPSPLGYACRNDNKEIITKLIMFSTDSHVYAGSQHKEFINSIKWTYDNHKQWPIKVKQRVNTILMVLYEEIPFDVLEMIIRKVVR